MGASSLPGNRPESAFFALFLPFSLFQSARTAPGKRRKRKKKAFCLRYPLICFKPPHLFNPHLRHSKFGQLSFEVLYLPFASAGLGIWAPGFFMSPVSRKSVWKHVCTQNRTLERNADSFGDSFFGWDWNPWEGRKLAGKICWEICEQVSRCPNKKHNPNPLCRTSRSRLRAETCEPSRFLG